MKRSMITVLNVVAVMLAACPALANPVVVVPGVDGTVSLYPTQTVGGAGVYGVELRSGNGELTGDWEIGVGAGTSGTGSQFENGQWAWDATFDSFSLDWSNTTTDTASFTIGSTAVTWPPELGTLIPAGNLLYVSTKRAAEIDSLTVNGVDILALLSVTELGDLASSSWPSGEVYLYDPMAAGKWTASGTLNLISGGSGSANEIFFQTGDFTPVPEPSTLILFGVGALGLLAYAWRRRQS